MAPQINRTSPFARNVAFAILVLWLIERLWPLIPDPGLRQLKYAVRPLLTPRCRMAGARGIFRRLARRRASSVPHARRQRAVDVLLIVIATVLVGRTFIAGNVLVSAEIAAIALLLPVLVLLSRLDVRKRAAVVALLLGSWLAWTAARPLLNGSTVSVASLPAFKELLLRSVPPPPQLASKGFSYMSLAWLLAGAGFVPHVAAGITVLFVALLVMLQLGAGGAVLRLGRPADRRRGRLDRRALDSEGLATLRFPDRTGSTDQLGLERRPALSPSISRRTSGTGPLSERNWSWNARNEALSRCCAIQSARSFRTMSLPSV